MKGVRLLKSKKSNEELMQEISKEREKLEEIIEKSGIEDLSQLVPKSQRIDKLINQYIKEK